jgi:hypothetical protein
MEKENIGRGGPEMRQMDWTKVIDALLIKAQKLEADPVLEMTAPDILRYLAGTLATGLIDEIIDSDLDRMRNAMRRPMTEP